MSRLIACLACLVAVVSGHDNRAGSQSEPDHVFEVRQRATWTSSGPDSVVVAGSDTVATIRPVGQGGRCTTWAFEYDLEPTPLGDFVDGNGTIERDAAGRLERATLVGRVVEGFMQKVSSVVLDGLEWQRRLGRDDQTAWVDTSRIRHAFEGDTVEVTRITRFRREDSTRHGAPQGEWHLTFSSDLQVRWFTLTERDLSRGPTAVTGHLGGTVSGSARYAPATCQADSVHEDGVLTGEIAFARRDSTRDQIAGTWNINRDGAWVPDPRSARQSALHYFMVHGRDSVGTKPTTKARKLKPEDTLALNSLLLRRLRQTNDGSRTDTPLRDGDIRDAALAWVFRHPERFVTPGENEMVGLFLSGWRFDGQGPLTVAGARALASCIATRRAQRRGLLDRPEVFSSILDALGDGGGVGPAAGPLLADAATHSDDRDARDLLLLAAYEADPQRYRPLVLRVADSTQGYGPIVREFVAGRSSLMNWSYGVDSTHVIRDSFPGTDAPWQLLAPYAGQSPDTSSRVNDSPFYWGGSGGVPRALDLWFHARGVDAKERFLARYQGEADSVGRIVFAGFLLMFGDTTALPWLRTVAAGGKSSLANRAETLMLWHFDLTAQTIADDDLLTDVQELMLRYADLGVTLQDSAGRGTAFSPHDERPGQHLLLAEGLTPRVRAHWKSAVEIVTREEVEARARRDGLVMAISVSPLRRLGQRYYINVDLSPFGQMCLCGGGTRFVLERRDNRWVVISAMSWVS